MTLAELNIKKVQFPDNQYIKEETPKKQIYLHHTAGNSSAEATFKYWAGNKERIATCVAIAGPGSPEGDGQIVQGFSSQHWAFHLGLKESTFQKHGIPYKSLDKTSIGIEICNWGQLTKSGDRYYNYVMKQIPADQVIELEKSFKGFKYFHNYSDAQIESTRKLLLFWKDRYGIPLAYDPGIWDISKDALLGTPGVYTHNSVRTDKIDVYPHPKLIEMLKSI